MRVRRTLAAVSTRITCHSSLPMEFLSTASFRVISRRALRLALAGALGICALCSGAAHAFSFDDVAKQARTLVNNRYKPKDPNHPK